MGKRLVDDEPDLPQPAAETNLSGSYDQIAQLYLDHVGNEMEQMSVDRAGLQLFVEMVGPEARTIDAGCGPGHIAAFLDSCGLSVLGVDISPAMIELAEASFPGIEFRVGRLADLPSSDSSVEAVVSRHSVIHTEPERLGEVFSEFARVLLPDGVLFLSFFATEEVHDHGRPFDHKACTADQLDPTIISSLLASHGLQEEVRLVRRPGAEERDIPHATLFARRTGARSGLWPSRARPARRATATAIRFPPIHSP